MAMPAGNPLAGLLQALQVRQAFQNLQNPQPQVPIPSLPIHNGVMGQAPPNDDEEDQMHQSLMSLGPRNQLAALARAKAVASTVQHLRTFQPGGLYGGK